MDDSYIPKYVLETQAKVCERIALASSTLSARRSPTEPTHDPTFPAAIPVGPPSDPYSSIRFAAHEVDAWIESRMALRPGHRPVSACTNATDSPEAGLPSAPWPFIPKTRKNPSR